MTMPFYVSPEQLMKDRADFARKGIGRGRGVVAVQYAEGIVLVSENPRSLHKISEIYDRVAFAAVGRYNEFENLRIAGVRLADMRGYAYDRRDVTGRGLANAYAQTLGTIFSSGGEKPYEVEIFVAEVGDTAAADELYRITYDGQMVDEHGFAAMGGDAESVTTYLREHWAEGVTLADALTLAVAALGHGADGDRQIPVHDLEVAVLDRTRSQPRKFRRLTARTLLDVLGPDAEASTEASTETGTETGTRTGADPGSDEPLDDDTSVAGGGAASHEPQVPDDPADPTDTPSSVPPLEDPITGEPPSRGPSPSDPAAPDDGPPVAPPLDRDDPLS